VCPASTNGVVGIKPTLGLIPATGIIPIAHSQDTAGPMARRVTDAAILLGALTGADYTKSLDPNGLRGARIGVARDKFFGFSEETDRVIEAAIAEMRRRGAEIVDPADIPTAGKFDDSESVVLSYEFKNDLNLYLGALGPKSPAHSLADVIAFNESHRDREMPYFGQDQAWLGDTI
jgi:amidase